MLQRRNYVKIDRKRFMPEDRGRIVTAFLQTYFPRYVEYNFTAHLEDELDEISDGKIDWRQVLREFWKAFAAAVGETKDLRVSEVLDKLDEELGPHFFPANDNGGKSPRDCPSCANGRLGLKLGKFGAFIGCSNYPDCRFTRKLGIVDPDADAASGANLDGPKVLGTDPATGKVVTLRNGPYGLYVQLGEAEGKEKPKRQSLLKGMTPGRRHAWRRRWRCSRCRASWGRIPRTASRSWPASAASARTSSTAPSTRPSRPTRACSRSA